MLEQDEDGEPVRIADLGARTFTSAENQKDGSSPAVDRRQKRGARRTLRRGKARLQKVKNFCIKHFFALQFENITNIQLENHLKKCGKQINFKNLTLSQINQLKKEMLFDLLYQNKENVYQLRAKALDEKLTNEQLAKILLLFVKHRGYKSNSKSELNFDEEKQDKIKEEDKEKEKKQDKEKKEKQKVKFACTQNHKLMIEKGYRTFGEMLFKDEKFYLYTDNPQLSTVFLARNKNGDYRNLVQREDLVDEIVKIFDSQRNFGVNLPKELEEEYISIFSSQLNFDDGPNVPSPYKKGFAVGACTFEKDEKRAPKASQTFTMFTFLQKLNNMKFVDSFSQEFVISQEMRDNICNIFITKPSLTFKQIRNHFAVPKEYKCNLINYSVKPQKENKKQKNPEDDIFVRNTAHPILVCFEEKPSIETIDKLALILSMNKSDEKRLSAMEEAGLVIDENIKQKLLAVNVSTFGFLSIKAMQKILPYLIQGRKYDVACEMAGYNHSKQNGIKNIKINVNSDEIKNQLADLTSPVVKRSVAQTIKVVNAIIDKYGSPSAIFVELGREMSKNFDERRQIEKDQKERQSKNEEIVKILKENGFLRPTGQDIIKYKLYMEQDGCCVYSGQSFLALYGNIKNAFSNNNTQIDHIVPYSKCYDDSMNNKVLVLASENQNKGQRLPFEAFGHDEQKWQQFVSFVESKNYAPRKKQNLFRKSISDDEAKELNSRALNDSKHIAKFMRNLFENHLSFAQGSMSKSPVRAVNGVMTGYLRKIWGLEKHRFQSDKHHIQDATVVACTNNGMIQRVSRYLQQNKVRILPDKRYANVETGEVFASHQDYLREVGELKYPYPHFLRELEILLGDNPADFKGELEKMGYDKQVLSSVKPIMISRMPTRKMRGAIHEDTIRSAKLLAKSDKNIYTVKTPITNLVLTENFEIKDYPEQLKIDDPALYHILKKRLIDTKIELEKQGKSIKELGKIAFMEPIFKPAKDGRKANQIKSVKLQTVLNSGLVLAGNQGFVKNDSIVRTDIFFKNGKYYAVPIYTSDFYLGILPNKAITAGKHKYDWDEMDNTFEFKFSLYPNDLIYLKKISNFVGKNKDSKAEITVNEGFYYWKTVCSSTAGIEFINHDKSFEFVSIGIKTGVISFEKYQVDMLGNISKPIWQPRQDFSFKK